MYILRRFFLSTSHYKMLPLDIINLLFHALIAIGIQATALFVFCKLRGPFKELSILRKDIAALRQKIQEETIKRRRWVKKKILAQQKTKDCPRVSKSTLAVVKKVLTKQKDLEKKNMELEDRVLDIKRSLMDKPSIVMSSQLKRLESFCDNLSANVKTQDFKGIVVMIYIPN
ncbi:hypothetical protein BD408DRAFT_486619 [Parasitella parasitica]|nr:hypothetical protein BD408DRAFT_486619 [Parasitella parasitica]